jgi:hypothetical protein
MLVLDDYSVFRKVYENPILKSRAPDASPKEVELGEARTEQVRLFLFNGAGLIRILLVAFYR